MLRYLLLLSFFALPLAAQQPPPDPDQHGHEHPAEVAGDAPAKEPEEEKWSVSALRGPVSQVPIDVTEGTWMSVDVSPDGRTVVFDLLGDLYLLPIAGGEPTKLTSGPAWDMQPRFSPDGRRIAFTSDRSGGDNIWIINGDGSGEVQVTKENFRLVNSPVWAPDGEWIAARKHFTSQRSLGAGEIWLWHVSGGEGLQLTKKPNDQKDAGEPAFSPDGRYVYYSQDTTPGSVFEYNKNPNAQIYTIQRLDRETGEIERLIGGSGGAIRPTPSPDGRSMAFIRRVRGKSVLHLFDLRSGSERAIWNRLDKDMQETWAIHGVYPGIAWVPGGESMVAWGGGKLNLIDMTSGTAREIPFRVQDSREVAETLRFPVDVAPSRFPVRMLRWVNVAPDGSRVVYEALGYLWVRDLPTGTPRRLTNQNDHFEAYPSFSRDGRSITYVSWDDQDLGSVRVIPSSGGASRIITRSPGHYVEPAFSPDGSRVVWRALGGDWLRSTEWGVDRGIFMAPVNGGEPVRIRRAGAQAHFGGDASRLYFMEQEGDKRLLRSVDLDGHDERTHLSSSKATEYRVSPDGRWVAFAEGFHAFIVPLVRTGGVIEVSPSTSSVPLRRVTRDAGEYLHWSGDSQRLWWSLGPELYSRELRESFAFVEGAPETLPEPAERGTPIGFAADQHVPSALIAFRGARIVSMNGDEVIDGGTVLVRGDRIEAVGPDSEVTVPREARVYDATGTTIVPGFVDVHWHGSVGSDELIPQQNWTLFSSLAFGVTTIHDPSNDSSEIFAASEMQRAGEIVGPRIFSTGTILYGADAPFTARVDSLDDARAHLRRMNKIGAISVKSYNQPRRDQRQQIVQAARELNMMVVPEGGSLYQHDMTMIVDGHTGIEHAVPQERLYEDVLQLWSGSGTGYTPTLVVGFGGWWGENYWYQEEDVWRDERLLTFTPRALVDQRSRRVLRIPEDELHHIPLAQQATALARRGVGVQIGAHGQREGLGAHWEMWMLAQGGMEPHRVLEAATMGGARYLGMDGEIGSLIPGKLADLVVIEGNPLEDIRQTREVRWTMVGGRLFDAASMNQIAPAARERTPFWFEEGAAGTE